MLAEDWRVIVRSRELCIVDIAFQDKVAHDGRATPDRDTGGREIGRSRNGNLVTSIVLDTGSTHGSTVDPKRHPVVHVGEVDLVRPGPFTGDSSPSSVCSPRSSRATPVSRLMMQRWETPPLIRSKLSSPDFEITWTLAESVRSPTQCGCIHAVSVSRWGSSTMLEPSEVRLVLYE